MKRSQPEDRLFLNKVFARSKTDIRLSVGALVPVQIFTRGIDLIVASNGSDLPFIVLLAPYDMLVCGSRSDVKPVSASDDTGSSLTRGRRRDDCKRVKGAVESGLDANSTAGILEEVLQGLKALDLEMHCRH